MAVYPFHRIILPFRLYDPPYSTRGHPNPKPLFNRILHLHPNRFHRIEIWGVGRPDQLLYSQLLPGYCVIMVDMRGGIILHYHNSRPFSCSSRKSKRIQKRKLNVFTIDEPINPPLRILSSLLQLRRCLRICNPQRCKMKPLQLGLFPLPFPLKLSLCVTGLFLSNENTIGPAIDLLALVLREASRDRR